MASQKRKQYTREFKREAVELVIHHGYSIAEAARSLGIHAHMLGCWRQEQLKKQQEAFPGSGHQSGEAGELSGLRGENRKLRLEREILKKRRRSSRGSPGRVCICLPPPVRVSGPR